MRSKTELVDWAKVLANSGATPIPEISSRADMVQLVREAQQVVVSHGVHSFYPVHSYLQRASVSATQLLNAWMGNLNGNMPMTWMMTHIKNPLLGRDASTDSGSIGDQALFAIANLGTDPFDAHPKWVEWTSSPKSAEEIVDELGRTQYGSANNYDLPEGTRPVRGKVSTILAHVHPLTPELIGTLLDKPQHDDFTCDENPAFTPELRVHTRNLLVDRIRNSLHPTVTQFARPLLEDIKILQRVSDGPALPPDIATTIQEYLLDPDGPWSDVHDDGSPFATMAWALDIVDGWDEALWANAWAQPATPRHRRHLEEHILSLPPELQLAQAGAADAETFLGLLQSMDRKAPSRLTDPRLLRRARELDRADIYGTLLKRIADPVVFQELFRAYSRHRPGLEDAYFLFRDPRLLSEFTEQDVHALLESENREARILGIKLVGHVASQDPTCPAPRTLSHRR